MFMSARRSRFIVVGALGAVTLAISAGVALAAVPLPSKDSFYTAPAGFAKKPNGTILRSRKVAVQGPTQLYSDTAYQLLFRSENATGKPIAAVTTVLVPSDLGAGPRRLLSYQTAEDSLSLKCAPSYTMQVLSAGTTQGEEDLVIALALAKGWDVDVPDYEGPLSEYAVGPIAGHITLDGIKAAERFAPARLPGKATKVGMMGYSGGSIPSIWANSMARKYAPSVHLVGNAVGGIVPNPIENLAQVNGGIFAGVIVAASIGVDRAYPSLDLNGLLNATGRKLAATDAVDGDGCSGGVVNSPLSTVKTLSNYPTVGALEAVPRVRTAFANLDLINKAPGEAPSYFFNEIHDEIAVIGPVEQLFAANCRKGAKIDFVKSNTGEHLTGVGVYALPALDYLASRFAGEQAPNTCP
jgi:secretory lipase